MSFKVGDMAMWPSGSVWEIIQDKGNDFEIKLISPTLLGRKKVGDIALYPKADFTAAVLFNPAVAAITHPIALTIPNDFTINVGQYVGVDFAYNNQTKAAIICECGAPIR